MHDLWLDFSLANFGWAPLGVTSGHICLTCMLHYAGTRRLPRAMAKVNESKPNHTGTFQVPDHMTSANILMVKARHVAKRRI